MLPFIIRAKEAFRVATDSFINDIWNFIDKKLNSQFVFDDKYSHTDNEAKLQ